MSAEALVDGAMLVAGRKVLGTAGSFRAVDPATGEELEPEFGHAAHLEVDAAARLADDAFEEFRASPPDRRARLLDAVAAEIDELGDALVERAVAETGLPAARIRSERTRTTSQLRFFAASLRHGDLLKIRIDDTPDLRQRQIPVGPVAVFGSSNFPLAFSSAGGDVASALAVGCPVVVKVHNAHPGTAMLVAGAVSRAIAASELPAGVYSALIGPGTSIGAALVSHPAIRAVGFTGSRSGGLALTRLAEQRPVPIPVFAEMSSINPVFLFPSRLDLATARAYVESMTLGAGQFCTNPGVVFVPTGAAGDRFVGAVAELIRDSVGQTMLTGGIADAFDGTRSTVAAASGVRLVAQGAAGGGPNSPAATVLEADVAVFAADDAVREEMFGPGSVIIRYDAVDELLAAAETLEGQLTASLHGETADHPAMARVLRILERKAGRIIVNGWPTGVAVTHAMVHGGPYPATSDGRSSSVGTLAIHRWLRPVAYQGVPQELLPTELRDDAMSGSSTHRDMVRSAR